MSRWQGAWAFAVARCWHWWPARALRAVIAVGWIVRIVVRRNPFWQ